MEDKICIIDNDVFSYILKVDNIEILFQGGEAAEYFDEHYKKLGYEVIRLESYKIADPYKERE